MQPTSVLRAQLLRLCAGDTDASEALADDLTSLGRVIIAAVPSTVSVTVCLVRDGVELSVALSVHNGAAHGTGSSAAVPLPAGGPGALLILRSADAGAFAPLLGLAEPWLGLNVAFVQIDQHLAPSSRDPGASLTRALSDLLSIQQAVGALIEIGFEPDDAQGELARRAEIAGTTVAAASQAVLAALPREQPGAEG